MEKVLSYKDRGTLGMTKVTASHVLKGGKMILRAVKPLDDYTGVNMEGIVQQ